MGISMAIDFGTTNTVVASRKDNSETEIVSFPGLSLGTEEGLPPLVPSLVFVQDGRARRMAFGKAVIDQGLTLARSNRLFRNFKRGIVAAPPPAPRSIDGEFWGDRDVAQSFLRQLFAALPLPMTEIDQLVLTAPVASFEPYLTWLNEALGDFPAERVHTVDEATAAALGYTITEPGARVLVFDFGGGTLDLSLVQLPEETGHAGGTLKVLLFGKAPQYAARVIAKAGRILGGSDVDQWLMAEILSGAGLHPEDAGDDAVRLLTLCEQIKISLSLRESIPIEFSVNDRVYRKEFTRTRLEELLAANGFYETIRRVLDQVMTTAHRQGLMREDIRGVLMVGGMSLMPSVQREVKEYFAGGRVLLDKPFTAVVEGALQLAAGYGLEDYLAHSYGLRYLNRSDGSLRYDEIIPMGSRYPSEKPVEVILGASRFGQDEIEFVIGEMGLGETERVEVHYENGQAVFLAQAADGAQQIRPLNANHAVRAALNPPGETGEDRLRAIFRVDDRRQLRLSVYDLRTRHELAAEQVVTSLGTDGAGEDTAPGTVTGREPCLSAGDARTGQHRLSLRGLARVMNYLTPEAISIDAAAEALHSPEFYVRYRAAELLARRGDRAARRVLEETLNRDSPLVRASVARQLFRLSWVSAEALHRQAFRDPDMRVHECAVYGLCNRRDADALRLLCELLPGEPDSVRMAAAWGLVRCQDAAAIPVLEIALQAHDPDARVKALESLGETELPEAAPVIRSALFDLDDEVKYAATLSLLEVKGAAALDEIAGLALNHSGNPRQSYLRGLFHGTNYLLIDVGGSPAAEDVLSALEAACRDELAETRRIASAMLAWMRHPRAQQLLHEVYAGERDSSVKAYMVSMAANLSSEIGEELLNDAAQSTDPVIQEAIAPILLRKQKKQN